MFSGLEQIQISLHQAFKMGRTSYTVEFKLKAVNRLNNEFNGSISKASRAIGITKKMLRDWCKNEIKMANLKDKRIRRNAVNGSGAKSYL